MEEFMNKWLYDPHLKKIPIASINLFFEAPSFDVEISKDETK
jgi:hypothetical protein